MSSSSSPATILHSPPLYHPLEWFLVVECIARSTFSTQCTVGAGLNFGRLECSSGASSSNPLPVHPWHLRLL
ncbi:unnamed protein product [Victoria cruziana]